MHENNIKKKIMKIVSLILVIMIVLNFFLNFGAVETLNAVRGYNAMPKDNEFFYSNLNFIYNFKDNESSVLRRHNQLTKDLNSLESRLIIIKKTIEELTFNKQLADKNLKAILNITKTLSMFRKKIQKESEIINWVKSEATKLSKTVVSPTDITDNLVKKSEILFDKLSYKNSQMDLIDEFLNFFINQIDKIEIRGRTIKPSLDNILKIFKAMLSKTEEYNVGRLKRAQQKFEKSKLLNDFMYGKKNPKLAHLLSLDGAVPVKTNEYSELRTPFGSVWVKRSSSDGSRMIYIISLDSKKERALKYDDMCNELDRKFNPEKTKSLKYREDAITGLIKPINLYVKQPLTESQNYLGTSEAQVLQAILFKVKYKCQISKLLTISQKESASFLCGVLLLSESHEFRNPTGGKFERKAIKNVLRLAENNCTNPFSVVFCNAKARYIPARDKGDEKGDVFPGGQRQASILINLHRINVKYLCTNADFDRNRDRSHAAFLTDYIKTVTNVITGFGNPKETWKIRNAMLQSGKISSRFDKTSPYFKIYKEFCKGFAFLNLFKKMRNNETFNIDDLPDLPKESFLTKIKILTKTKNLKRLNKLLNNSIINLR